MVSVSPENPERPSEGKILRVTVKAAGLTLHRNIVLEGHETPEDMERAAKELFDTIASYSYSVVEATEVPLRK